MLIKTVNGIVKTMKYPDNLEIVFCGLILFSYIIKILGSAAIIMIEYIVRKIE